MRRRRPGVTDVLFSMAATTAVAGALVAFRAWWLAPAVALAALSPFLEWRTLPSLLHRWLPGLLRAVLVLTFLAVWFTRPMPLLLDQDSRWIPRALASVLSAIVMTCVLARPRLPAGSTLIPALAGLLVVTGADPAPTGFGSSVVPAFRAAGHNGFADLYVALAVLVAAIVWAALLSGTGPHLRGRSARGALPMVAAALLCAAGVVGLPAAQPRVEQAVAEAMSSAATGLASGATLGDFGELAVSRRRVLDLRASVPDAGWRLRAEALTAFDGRHWSTGESGPARVTLLAPRAEPPVSDALTDDLGSWFLPMSAGPPDGPGLRITQHALESWPLLLPQHVAAVSAATPWLEQDAQGFLRRTRGSSVMLYGAVLSTRPPAPAPLDPDETSRALAVPKALDPRIARLAASLSPPDSGARERVAHTVAHLRSNYRYTLSPGRFRAHGDPVAEFLFEKKQAYCEYFASAAVLLLRLQGVPARFVKGLSVGRHNRHGKDLYVVRESDAHAWVEAWLPDEGWIEADPTPPADFAAAHAPPGRWDEALESTRAALAELWAMATGPGLERLLRRLWAASARAAADITGRPRALAALAAALATLLALPRVRETWRSWRRLRARRLAPGVPRELLLAVEAMEQRWQRSGNARPPNRGLREHACLGAADPGDLALVDRYYAARFGSPGEETRTVPPAGS